MTSALAINAGFAAVVLMLAAVVGTVERRERYGFVVGVVALLVGLTAFRGAPSAAVATVVVGFVLVLGSALNLLRRP